MTSAMRSSSSTTRIVGGLPVCIRVPPFRRAARSRLERSLCLHWGRCRAGKQIKKTSTLPASSSPRQVSQCHAAATLVPQRPVFHESSCETTRFREEAMQSERLVDVLDREERAPKVEAQALRRGESAGDGRAPWVVVLAGGDGRRLLGLTLDAHGESIPKQFYRFRDARSLLGETLERARALTPESRILVIVVEAHRRWWEAELAGLDPSNILVQPANRGTAIAILLGWAQVRSRDAYARLVFMPSDHEVDDADRLVAAMGDALARTAAHAESLVFLGMTPRETDGEYGFLVPGAGPHVRRARGRALRREAGARRRGRAGFRGRAVEHVHLCLPGGGARARLSRVVPGADARRPAAARHRARGSGRAPARSSPSYRCSIFRRTSCRRSRGGCVRSRHRSAAGRISARRAGSRPGWPRIAARRT